MILYEYYHLSTHFVSKFVGVVLLVNLKYWRKKRNLTQVQLAILLYTTTGYIYEIESGKKVPSLKMLYKLAEKLDVCPKELLECNCKRCT